MFKLNPSWPVVLIGDMAAVNHNNTDNRVYTLPDKSDTFAMLSDIGLTKVFNVQLYGATGNGATDDTAAVQNAINAAQANGGIVYFPPGTYIVSSDPTISANNVVVMGAGRASIIKSKSASSANCLKISGASHVVIRDLQIDGNRANQSGGVSYSVNAGIRISQCDDVLVEDCYVHDTYSQGIYAENSTNLIIQGNRVHNTGDGGIFLHPQSTSPACTNVIIANNVVDMAGYYGITAIRSDYVTIVGNASYNNGQADPSQGFGIDLEGSRYSVVQGNICHDGHGGILCRITTEGGASQNCNRVTIQGNTCYNNTPAGTHGEASIQLTDSDYILVANNFCSTAPQGINIGNATFVNVVGNTCTAHTNAGIRAYSSSGSNLSILNNFVVGNSNNGIQTAVPRTFIAGNHIKANTYEGIEFLAGSSNSVARHNYILDNTDNGILVDGSGTSGVEVNSNEFDNTSTAQGRALYEAGGGGPTSFVNNRVINQSNQDYSLSNASSQFIADRTKFAAVTSGTSYAAKSSDVVVLVNKGTGSATTVTLPTGVAGMEIVVKDGKGDANTNNITVNTSSSQTIDGAASVIINTSYGRTRLYFNGTQWNVIG